MNIEKRRLHRKTRKVALTLGQFLLQQMDARKLSMREFARAVGITQSTISRYVNGTDNEPSLGVLRKIAKYTGIPLGALIAIAYPDVATDLVADPEVALIIQEFNALPKSARKLILAAVRGMKNNGSSDENTEGS